MIKWKKLWKRYPEICLYVIIIEKSDQITDLHFWSDKYMKGDVEPLLKLRESTTGLYTRQFENAAKQLNEIIESQKKALGAFDKAMIEASDSFTKPYFEAIKELSSFSSQNLINSIWDKNSILLKDTFEKLQQQEKIRKQIKLIGSSGWTAIPDTYFESYLQAGKEKEQIDEFFYSLLTDDVISKLFEELLDKTDQKTDVEEAIIDYNSNSRLSYI